VGVELVT